MMGLPCPSALHARMHSSCLGWAGGAARKLAGWVATRPGGARRAMLDVAVDVGVGDPIIKKHHFHPLKKQAPVLVKKQSPVVVKQKPVVVKKSPVVQKVRPDALAIVDPRS